MVRELYVTDIRCDEKRFQYPSLEFYYTKHGYNQSNDAGTRLFSGRKKGLILSRSHEVRDGFQGLVSSGTPCKVHGNNWTVRYNI